MNEVLSILLTVIVGVSLGILGSGGSIVMLPILVYVAGVDPKQAVGMSLAVVGSTSAIGAVSRYRKGEFHAQAAALFSVSGVIGAFLGSGLTHFVSPHVLMLLFAALMLVVSVAMLRRRIEVEAKATCFPIRCLAMGSSVGVLTGFLGVGGGFLIVPALVLFAGVETKKAVGASLGIIAFNSASGLLGHLFQTRINWLLSLAFLVAALVGMFVGAAYSRRISDKKLSKLFAWFLLVVAVVIGGINGYALFAS